ncbi:MAG: hypothetical protein ABI407_14495, partial [Bradyrhizobium sp.]
PEKTVTCDALARALAADLRRPAAGPSAIDLLQRDGLFWRRIPRIAELDCEAHGRDASAPLMPDRNPCL